MKLWKMKKNIIEILNYIMRWETQNENEKDDAA